jgi:stage III sporulation protein AA
MGMDAIFEILPEKLKSALSALPLEKVYELRLRANSPAVVCISGRNMFLGSRGVTDSGAHAAVVSRVDLDNIIHKAAGYAIYAVNDQIRNGFVTIRGGVRIGLCGEVVAGGGGGVSTIKNLNALCIRFPHEIKNCAYPLLPYIFGDNRPYNTLIVAPPGAGKTTILRDLAVQVSAHFPSLNTLVLDERGEIAANYLGDNQLFVGDFTDTITGGTKKFGFENGIRSMRPDVILTDEIATADDAELLKTAVRSGVVVAASVHAGGIDEIRRKPAFREIIAERIFDRFAVLAVRDHAGTLVGVYDENLKVLES